MALRPDLGALTVLDLVDRRGTVAAAAEALGLTPSAATHRLKNLEASMGFPLTARSGRSLALTPRGRRYLDMARPALGILAKAESAARERRVAGPLRVAAAPGFAAAWLCRRVGGFADAFPEVSLLVGGAGPAEAEILFITPASAQTGDRWLSTPQFFPVAAPALAHGPSAPRGAADLGGRRLLHLFDGRDWVRWGAAHGMTPGPAGMTFEDANLMLAAAEAGAGFALGDALTCADALRRGALARSAAGEIESDRSYFLRLAPGPSPTAAAFADWLIAALRDPDRGA